MASRGINKTILVGYLGQDPEIRYMPNGNAVAKITLATSDTWRDKQTGETKEKTEWHRVILFSKLAEIAAEYLKKGSLVYIEGSLQTRKWQDQNGQDRYITEIIVNINGSMQMLSSRQGLGTTVSSSIPHGQHDVWNQSQSALINNSQSGISSIQDNKHANIKKYTHSTAKTVDNDDAIDFDEDIPF